MNLLLLLFHTSRVSDGGGGNAAGAEGSGRHSGKCGEAGGGEAPADRPAGGIAGSNGLEEACSQQPGDQALRDGVDHLNRARSTLRSLACLRAFRCPDISRLGFSTRPRWSAMLTGSPSSNSQHTLLNPFLLPWAGRGSSTPAAACWEPFESPSCSPFCFTDSHQPVETESHGYAVGGAGPLVVEDEMLLVDLPGLF